MDTNKLKLGDKAYGAIATYNGRFQKGYKIGRFKVVKETKWNIWITFDKDSEECPQRLRRCDSEFIQKTERLVWLAIVKKEKDPYYLKCVPKKILKEVNTKRIKSTVKGGKDET